MDIATSTEHLGLNRAEIGMPLTIPVNCFLKFQLGYSVFYLTSFLRAVIKLEEYST